MDTITISTTGICVATVIITACWVSLISQFARRHDTEVRPGYVSLVVLSGALTFNILFGAIIEIEALSLDQPARLQEAHIVALMSYILLFVADTARNYMAFEGFQHD